MLFSVRRISCQRNERGSVLAVFHWGLNLFSTIPSLSQRGMHTVVKEHSESPSEQQPLASPSAPVCSILGLNLLFLTLVWCYAAKLMIYKSISLLCWGLLPIALLTLICFLGSAPLKTFIMLFLNAWGKTGMGNNKGMGLVWGFSLVLFLSECGAKLNYTFHLMTVRNMGRYPDRISWEPVTWPVSFWNYPTGGRKYQVY